MTDSHVSGGYSDSTRATTTDSEPLNCVECILGSEQRGRAFSRPSQDGLVAIATGIDGIKSPLDDIISSQSEQEV
jgi:hypothetical protein